MSLFLTQLPDRLALIRRIGFSCLLALLMVAGFSVEARAKLRIMIYGDSLAAGYGLKPTEGFAPQLERALAARRMAADIHNASQSGETTAGGLARLQWNLDGARPDIVILELGANDALRALPWRRARANLDQMLIQLKARKITILLAGMMAPPNLGRAYVEKFNAIYPTLARKHKVVLYPFFLDGVAGQRLLNLRDGKHPNAKGIKRIVKGILPFVEKAVALALEKKGKK